MTSEEVRSIRGWCERRLFLHPEFADVLKVCDEATRLQHILARRDATIRQQAERIDELEAKVPA